MGGPLAFLGMIAYIGCIGLGICLLVGYQLLRDSLFGGRSLGKKIMGLKVINTKTNGPCSKKDSVLRNITLIIPVVGLIDVIMGLVDAEGLRIGDKIAGTKVVQ
jgi:uncharacterized RDD family membrane protein YckC